MERVWLHGQPCITRIDAGYARRNSDLLYGMNKQAHFIQSAIKQSLPTRIDRAGKLKREFHLVNYAKWKKAFQRAYTYFFFF